MSNLNIIITPFPLEGELASSKRLKNLFYPLCDNKNIKIFSLFKTKQNEITSSNKLNIEEKSVIISKRNKCGIFVFTIKAIVFLTKKRNKTAKNILYHYHNPDFYTIFLLLYARLIGYKIVFDIVEDVFTIQTENKSLKSKFRVYSYRFFTKRLKRLGHGFIGISDHIVDQLSCNISKNEQILKLPISINKKDFLLETKKSDNLIRLFYGGSFRNKDGLYYLLSAFDSLCSEYPQLRLLLTGRANRSDQILFDEKFSKLRFKHQVELLGYLEESDYYRTLLSCDIFCMTRVNSAFAKAGFPFKLGEFLATGKPVIATKIGEVPKYLNSSNAYLIEPNSVTEIYQAVKYIISNPDEAAKIGYAGKVLALEEFENEKHSAKLLNFFNII